MEMAPAATSARPAVRTSEEGALVPESPAARAKGTVRPSDTPMMTSRTTSPAVKCRSRWLGRFSSNGCPRVAPPPSIDCPTPVEREARAWRTGLRSARLFEFRVERCVGVGLLGF